MVKSDFSWADNKPENLASTVFNGLKKKYLIDTSSEKSIEDLYFKDGDNHRLKFIINGLAVSIYYYTGEEKILQSLLKELRFVKSERLIKDNVDRILELI